MTAPDRMDERLRSLRLTEAQRMAHLVFAVAVEDGLLAPGRTEREVDDRIWGVARDVFGSLPDRPGRMVRSGPHTVLPYEPETPSRAIGVDDMVVVDFGPLLAGHETDFARTVLLGDDAGGRKLVEDLAKVGAAAREVFLAEEGITGRELHGEIRGLAAKAGWALGTWHAGRLCGQASAAVDASGVRTDLLVGPDNDRPLRRTVEGGWKAHWIVEIRLVDECQGFGGSFKQLLDLA
ncbi:M24 family metallopeptidase [Streptomyces sp. NPDC003952]